MCFYSAMELIDPTAPGISIPIETWKAVEVIYNKHDLNISIQGVKFWRYVMIVVI